jgi:hypothetical protein
VGFESKPEGRRKMGKPDLRWMKVKRIIYES